MWFWLIALAATTEPASVRLQLEAGLGCDLNASLPDALIQQQIRIAAPSETSAWVLVVGKHANGIELRIANAQGVLRGERRLGVTPSDCDALPRTTALLVRSWL